VTVAPQQVNQSSRPTLCVVTLAHAAGRSMVRPTKRGAVGYRRPRHQSLPQTYMSFDYVPSRPLIAGCRSAACIACAPAVINEECGRRMRKNMAHHRPTADNSGRQARKPTKASLITQRRTYFIAQLMTVCTVVK